MDRLREDGTQSRADIDKTRSEVATLKGAATSLRRDVKSAQQAWDTAGAAVAELDSVMFKVKKQLAWMRSRVGDLLWYAHDHEAMLEEMNSACNALRV